MECVTWFYPYVPQSLQVSKWESRAAFCILSRLIDVSLNIIYLVMYPYMLCILALNFVNVNRRSIRLRGLIGHKSLTAFVGIHLLWEYIISSFSWGFWNLPCKVQIIYFKNALSNEYAFAQYNENFTLVGKCLWTTSLNQGLSPQRQPGKEAEKRDLGTWERGWNRGYLLLLTLLNLQMEATKPY